MSAKTKSRILTDGLLFVSAFVFPWWLAVVAALVLSFYYSNFIELMAVGFVLDSIYSVSGAGLFDIPYTLTGVTIVLFIIIRFLKMRMVFHNIFKS